MWTKRKIKIYLSRFYVFFYGCFHKVEKKVLFDSFAGKQYSDSPRAISEKLHELYPEYQIVWKLNNPNVKYNLLPEYVKIVSNRRAFIKELATCLCYVTNEGMEPDKYKKKNQFFIQTWHGDRGYKKVLYQAWEKKKRPIPITDNKVTNLCIAASDYGERTYRTAFKYNGEILKIGMPRNDKLIKNSSEEYKKIRRRLNISEDVKILLFAPTFRDNINTSQTTFINLNRLLDQLARDGEKWICLTRAHSSSKGLDIINDDGNIINATDYPDIADLLMISDMLITDYSSCAGDFILSGKPVILAIFDNKMYKENCRSSNYEIEDSKYIIAHTQEELESIIRNTNANEYKDNCELVKKFFNIIETGNSSEEICNRIKEFEIKHKI